MNAVIRDTDSLAVAFRRQRWYAACTKSSAEQIARSNLAAQGFEVYLPMMKIGRRVRNLGWGEFIEPLFPGYLFVRFDPTTKSAAPIRSTKGVTGLVRFGADPATIPDEIIAELRERENSSGLHVDSTARLAPGDKVRMVQGPFAGFVATLEHSDGGARVAVLLAALGSVQHLTVPRAMVLRVTV